MTENGTENGSHSPLILIKDIFPPKSSHILTAGRPKHHKRVMSVVFYTILSDDTRKISSVPQSLQRFAMAEEFSMLARRIGDTPKNPSLLLLQQGTKQFVLELTTRHALYGDYSAAQQRNARQLHPSTAEQREPRLHKVAKRLAGRLSVTKVANRRFYSVHTWNNIMNELRKKGPTPTVQRHTSSKSIVGKVEKVLKELTHKKSVLDILGDDATPAATAALEMLVCELEDTLTLLYSPSENGAYLNLFSNELKSFAQSRINALNRACMADADITLPNVNVNLHSNVEALQLQLLYQFDEMNKLQSDALNTAIDVMTNPESMLSKALAPYSLTSADVLKPLLGSNTDICIDKMNAGSMENVTKNIANALQLLVACQDKPNQFFGIVGASAWLKVRTTKIATLNGSFKKVRKMTSGNETVRFDLKNVMREVGEKSSGEKSTSSSSSSSSTSRTLLQRWETFVNELMLYVSARLPSNEHTMRTRLNTLLKPWGGFTTVNNRSVGTQIQKWTDPTYYCTKLLRPGLIGLWYIATHCVDFDGSPQDFVRIYLQSEFGVALVKAYVAWRSVASRLLNNAITTETWVKPLLVTTTQPKVGTLHDKLIFGDCPLKLSVEWLWIRLIMEWPVAPKGNPKEGGPTTDQVACARFTSFVFSWALITKYGFRAHCLEEISIVTAEQFEALDANYWLNREMQLGVWIVYTDNSIKIHIIDSKLVKVSAGGLRNQISFEKNKYCADIMSNGLYIDGSQWFEEMYERIKWAYNILTPSRRRYTSDIWDMDQKRLMEIDMYYMPTPMTPQATTSMLLFDQEKFKKNDGTHFDNLKELSEDALRKVGMLTETTDSKGTKTIKHRKTIKLDKQCAALKLQGIEVARMPERATKYSHVHSQAGLSSGTNIFYTQQMGQLVSQFGDNALTMRNSYSSGKKPKPYTWSLGAYQPKDGQTKKIAEYAFKKQYGTRQFRDRKDLVGARRLFGGNFTDADVLSLKVLSSSVKKKELIYDIKRARHSNIARFEWAIVFLGNFVQSPDSSHHHSKNKQAVALHPLRTTFDNERAKLLEREVHFSDETVKSYCSHHERAEVCNPRTAYVACMMDTHRTHKIKEMLWSHPTMKDRNGKYLKKPIDIGGRGITNWPTTLCPCYATAAHENQPVLQRCHDFQLLEPIEQIEMLQTLSSFRTFLTVLHKNYTFYSDSRELGHLWEFVEDISTPPNVSTRASKRRKLN